MDLKKSFNPSTWLPPKSWRAGRAGEMSVLFPITTAYTIVYLGMMIADFVLKDVYTAPTAMMIAYGALLVAYAGDKEVRRWMGKEEPSRRGSLFVYAWFVFLLVVLIISSIFKEFAAPTDVVKVCLEVLGVFFGSKASKKIYEVKQTKREEAFSREDKILAYLEEHKEGKNNDFATILGISESTVRRMLNKMEAKGLVEQHGDRKSASYTLKNGDM